MASVIAIWHGTDDQIKVLVEAVNHHCSCDKATIINPNPPKCPAHAMLLEQATLDRFAYVGLRAQKYWFNEFLT